MKKSKDVDIAAGSVSQVKSTEDISVQYLKGVGPARAKLLEKLNLRSLEDIMLHFPRRYEDRRNLRKISGLKSGAYETTSGRIVSTRIITTPKRRMQIVESLVKDDSGTLVCKWFNQPYLKQYLREGHEVVLSGVTKAGLNGVIGLEMENPDFELIGDNDKLIHTSRIVPFHNATKGLSPRQIRALIFNVLDKHIDAIKDYLPEDIRQRNRLKPLGWSIKEAHFPAEINDVGELNRGESPAHLRIVFDEFFIFQLGIALAKKINNIEKGIALKGDNELLNRFFQRLPFSLTGAQKRAVDEIISDMNRGLPMNRLLHGDVGCGKTVVALASMLTAVGSGYQACLMAPTELLAEQHYFNIHGMTDGLGIRTVLLTSSTKGKPLADILGGSADIIIGTHSIIQDAVEFKALGLAVIDEQHRFGVVQRAGLRSKGDNPDILIMTATPIPRTLALTVYGDLEVSLIDELPSNRKPVMTRILFPSQRDEVYSIVEREVAGGRQVYIVYPLIETSDKVDLKPAIEGADALKKKFPGRRIDIVHGRLNTEERESVMNEFKAGKIDMLVATTVIEVGIDVPNASLMLIVHAERFGLSQLHQLRGRIGRGDYQSYCLLLAYPPFSEDAEKRLKAVISTNDGFRIAEEDLAIRGPGEFFGTRQSGFPEFRIADIIRDKQLLETARREAFDLVDSDPKLKGYPLLKAAVEKRWAGRLALAKS
ncbi:MAG: ATP-dependent DNA helicase RecG [Nitrospirae bacterium]|nr:ATP-dependent DNA helicase RecG [Nitrospirota bacterium]